MNVDIRDRAVFDALEPQVIVRYLIARGWQERRRVPDEMAVYELSQGDDEPIRIWLPLSRRFSDYAVVMSNAFKTLSEAEHKAQLSMLDDLQTQSIGDVIRVGSEDPFDRADHTVPLADGVVLHEQARQMALSGAWNAASGDSRKPIYPLSTRVEILKYMQRLRLAQTERGSFIIRLISPINEHTLDQMALSSEIPIQSPFERRAVVELLRGLRALRQAAHDANRRGKFYFKAFEDLVPEGVSANLCDAVAPIPTSNSWRPVRVSVAWCDVIQVPQQPANTEVAFDASMMQYIREAALEFRRRNPEEIILRGAVTDLHRPKTMGAGEVRIYGMVNGRARYIRVALNQQDYDVAVDAHKKYREVSVSGTLVPKSTGLWLLNDPKNFHLLGDEPDQEKAF